MSKKRRNFSAKFKKKVIIKMFEENLTINEIASEFELLPNTVKQWKKQFLENARHTLNRNLRRDKRDGI